MPAANRIQVAPIRDGDAETGLVEDGDADGGKIALTEAVEQQPLEKAPETPTLATAPRRAIQSSLTNSQRNLEAAPPPLVRQNSASRELNQIATFITNIDVVANHEKEAKKKKSKHWQLVVGSVKQMIRRNKNNQLNA